MKEPLEHNLSKSHRKEGGIAHQREGAERTLSESTAIEEAGTGTALN